MTEVTIGMSDVERLAARLDAVDLSDEDRSALHAIFGLAGRAINTDAGADADEVSGFALESIQWGGSSGGNLFGTFLACCNGQHYSTGTIVGRPPTGAGE